MEALSGLWIPELGGALLMAAILALLYWRLGSSIIVTLVFWLGVLVEIVSATAFIVGHRGASLNTLWITSLLGTIAIIIVVWNIYSRVVIPIRELTTVAQRIAQGDVQASITYRGGNEVGQLADAFRDMVAYLQRMAQAAGRIADGDLSVTITPASPEDTLGNAFHRMEESLRDITVNVRTVSGHLASASEELSSMTEEVNTSASQVTETVQQVARGVSIQAEQAEQVSRSMEVLTRATEQIVENVRETEQAVEATREAVEHLTQYMHVLHEQSEGIDHITTTVKRFADQTNLLALNAAIEAARAGEHGKSFAVVAEEVRRLAENSREAVTEIATLNTQIQEGVDRVLSGVEDITVLITRTAELARHSLQAAESQRVESERVQRAVEEVASISEEQATSAEEMAAAVEEQMVATEQLATAAQELSEMAATLQTLVSRFRVEES